MHGRERKIVRAALRASHDALAEIEPAATGDRPASAQLLARSIRTLLEGQIAILEALGGPALRESGDPEAMEVDRPAPRRPSPARPEPPARAAPLPFEPPEGAAPAKAPAADGKPAPVGADLAQEAIRAFPLEDMSRWITSGTVFQIRGTLVFLNMNSMGGAKVDEMRGHIRKMGYTEELGVLEAPGVTGSILLFRRPE